MNLVDMLIEKEDFYADANSFSVENDPYFGLIEKLHGRFPEAFPANKKVPLAIGISYALRKFRKELDMSVSIINIVLSRWCSDKAYYEACLVPGTPRIDLFGNNQGTVDYQHSLYAKKMLMKLADLGRERLSAV